jgi:predicted transcriptional regulator
MEEERNNRDLKIIQKNLDEIRNQIRFVQSKVSRLDNGDVDPLKRILRQLDDYIKEMSKKKNANV